MTDKLKAAVELLEQRIRFWEYEKQEPDTCEALRLVLTALREAQAKLSLSGDCALREAADSTGDFHYPHMCRDEHEEVGFLWAEERCPACFERDRADAARREEREALRDYIERRRSHDGMGGEVNAHDALVWLDARSRAEERK